MVIKAPDKTREALLQAAFREIHRSGFQAASIDAILANVGVTKGALYHHFPNKRALGYAVVEELIARFMEERWRPVLESDDPITAIQNLISSGCSQASLEDLKLGCPFNNIALEMSPIDEGFRQRIEAVYNTWYDTTVASLSKGQKLGKVDKKINVERVSTFLLAAFEGSISLAKCTQNPDVLKRGADAIIDYLETLRPAGTSPTS